MLEETFKTKEECLLAIENSYAPDSNEKVTCFKCQRAVTSLCIQISTSFVLIVEHFGWKNQLNKFFVHHQRIYIHIGPEKVALKTYLLPLKILAYIL